MNQYQTNPSTKDNKINLAELIYYVLLRWRSILLVAILFCVVLSGFKLMKEYDSAGSQDLIEEQKKYDHSYGEYMIIKTQLENRIDQITQAIQQKDAYHQRSILMNLNPNTAYKSTLTYTVKDIADTKSVSSNTEAVQLANIKINSIIGSYTSLIRNGVILQNMQKEIKTNVDEKCLAELVYAQADYQSKLLHITVLGDDIDMVQTFSDAIDKELQNASSEISAEVGGHQLKRIASNIGNDMDTSILIGSIPEYGGYDIASYQTSIESLQKNDSDYVADLQGELMDCNNQLSKLNKPTEPESFSRGRIVKSGIKFGLLGFVIGAFIMAYCYVLQYLACGKLMASNEMRDDYGISVLANYKAPITFHPNVIDKLIYRMCSISDNMTCLSKVYTLAASNVLARVGITENVKILLVGNASAEVFDTTAFEMIGKLSDADIEVIAAGNINEDENAIRNLHNAEKIVLVEQAGVSRKKDIKRELQTLQDLNKEIVGAIVL